MLLLLLLLLLLPMLGSFVTFARVTLC